jgi:hypothetical protein
LGSKALRLYNVVDCKPQIYGEYRYLMSFKSKTLSTNKEAVVILMNPSTAGYIGNKPKVDSTLGKVLCWCHKNEFEKVEILNLFAYRETHPDKLNNIKYLKLIGSENNKTIKEVCTSNRIIITAWGDCKGIIEMYFTKRTQEVGKLNKGILHYVGELTKAGNPRHGRSWNSNPSLNKWEI